MDFYNKYKKLCGTKGVSPTKAAVEMGFSNAAYSYWSKGSTPKPATLQRIADYFNVDVDYFYIDDTDEKREPVTSQALGSLVMMPVIGAVRAGTGLMAQEEYTGEYMGVPVDAVHNNPQDYRILSVTGDSMYPIFIEGIDRVIVRVNDFDIVSGSYVVAILKNGDGVIKKLHTFEDGSFELRSVNPMYAPIKAEQVERIYGVVSRSERTFQ